MTQVTLNEAEVAILRSNPSVAVKNLLEQLRVPQAVDEWLGLAGFVYSDESGYVSHDYHVVVPVEAVWPVGEGPSAPLYCPHGHQRSINCPHGCAPADAVHAWNAVAHPELNGAFYSPTVDSGEQHVILGVGHNFCRLLSAWGR
jgi:hypothetical protein